MNVISLYSGADNLGDGIIQAGHNVRLAIESDRDCCETIRLNHPDVEIICGRVSDHLESLPRTDAVVGGPPCQNFSTANPKRTMDLTEVDNFKKAREITKCRYYFMENVRNIGKVLKDHNFLINCADYGVPQKRMRRIYTNLPLPEPTHKREEDWVTTGQALGLENGIIEDRQHYTDSRTGLPRKRRRYSVDMPVQTITCDARIWHVDDPKIRKKKGYGSRKKFNMVTRPAYTVMTRDRGLYRDAMVSDGKFARKLNIEELAVLQGFRKDFRFFGGRTSVRRQIGNALPAAVSKAFFEQVS